MVHGCTSVLVQATAGQRVSLSEPAASRCHFFLDGGGAVVPLAEGFDAFCFGGAAFFGFRISLPLTNGPSFRAGTVSFAPPREEWAALEENSTLAMAGGLL